MEAAAKNKYALTKPGICCLSRHRSSPWQWICLLQSLPLLINRRRCCVAEENERVCERNGLTEVLRTCFVFCYSVSGGIGGGSFIPPRAGDAGGRPKKASVPMQETLFFGAKSRFLGSKLAKIAPS
jgi:hypothetical protein